MVHLVANEFQKATGVKVSMSQKGSGETIAQLKAEAQNPKGEYGSAAPAIRTCRRPRKG